MDKLLEVLREKKYDKKPNVDTLKAIDGLGDVTAAQRDDAWDKYQKELTENAKDSSSAVQGSDADNGDNKSSTSQPAKNSTTTTTATTKQHKVEEQAKATHRVTVKRDGFRRLGRAWMGSTEVKLTEDEVNVLEADPMFVVVEL